MTAVHAPIGQLKARLSEYLARARAGEEVVITNRGTPVARLVPLSGARALEGRNAELARAGADLVTLDERLALVARLEGFNVLPGSRPSHVRRP